MAILISHKIEFQIKKQILEGHFVMIKGLIHQGYIITITNIYLPNNRPPKYMKQKWTKLREK